MLDIEQQDLLFYLLDFSPDLSFQEWGCLLYAFMYWNHVTCFLVLRVLAIVSDKTWTLDIKTALKLLKTRDFWCCT